MAEKTGKRLEKAVKNFFINLLAAVISDGKNIKVKPAAEIKSVLVIRPDRLGDFILTVPAIQLLKKNLEPGAKLTIMCGTRGLDTAKLYFPDCRIIVRKKGIINFKLCVLKTAFRHDAVINFHSYPFSMTSAMLTLFTFCGVRIGFKETQSVKNVLAPKIYNKGIVLNDDALHETKKNIALLPVLGIKAETGKIQLAAPDPGSKAADDARVFISSFKGGEKFVIIHPALLKKDNRWEQERYAEFAKMASDNGINVAAVAGMGEQDEMQKFKKMCAGTERIYYYPYSDIAHLLALGKKSACTVCNDSGIMHLFSLACPVVAVFGPSVLSRWKPIGPFNNICIQKEDKKCMSVSAKEVLSAVRENYLRV